MTDFLLDVRFAFRTLARAPRFAALAVVTLALGIGGTTALFSLVDAVLLRALPFKDPDRLVEIFGEEGTRTGTRVPGPILEALRERSSTLAATAIRSPTNGILHASDGTVDVLGDRVSANFLDVLGIPPLAGRGFVAEEERPGAPPVMLVSFRFWQQRLGGDPAAVGRTVSLDAMPYTIVGIMPPEFRTQFRRGVYDFWTPFAKAGTRELERTSGYELYARLAPGVTVDAARRETQAIAASAAGAATAASWREGRRRLGLHRLKDEVVRDSAYVLQLLLAAVGVVLAIACANLAQLLLARSDRRVSEFAIRKAMGAHPARLFRLALLESLMLSAAGGVAGVVLARLLMPAILALAPSEIPRLAEAVIDARVLAMAVGLSVLTGCAFGLAPALRLSRLSVVEAMKRRPGSAAPQRARARSALVVIQVAAAVALFILAGLVGQTFLALLPSNPGFEAESRTIFPMALRARIFSTPSGRRLGMETLVHRLEALPGVSGVALASNFPFSGEDEGSALYPADDDLADQRRDATPLQADVRAVSENVFQILQMPLVRGRIFTQADGRESPGVAIVNQSLARRLAPGGDVLGRTIRLARAAALPVYQVVGVVADARYSGTSVEVLNEVYIPFAQSPMSIAYLIVRSSLDSGTLTPAIRREIHAVAPDLPMRVEHAAVAMDDLVRRSLAGPRFSATLMTAFSAMALLLAAIGLFGLVAYSVTQRYHELGIRAALGARPGDLVVTTVRSAVVLTAIGVTIGLIAGAYLTRFVAGQLYAIAPLDGPTFAVAALVMLASAALAAFVPARRAMHTNPLTVLRYE